MEDFSLLLVEAQLTPSPQGFSSLPRVSEAFTPIAQQSHESRIKENKEEINENIHTQHTRLKKSSHAQPQHLYIFKS